MFPRPRNDNSVVINNANYADLIILHFIHVLKSHINNYTYLGDVSKYTHTKKAYRRDMSL